MIVLGIDTSGYTNAVGVSDGEKMLADFSYEAKADSLEKIVSNIDTVLKSAGFTLHEIDGIGVGLGPGSWTGIRVGVTVGKILAYSAGKSVCGVSTLEALAFSARKKGELICPVISAGTRDIVYAAFYRPNDDDITMTGDYYVGDIGGLANILKDPVVIAGPGAKSYGKQISRALGKPKIAPRTVEVKPEGAVIARLAAKRLECGKSDDAMALAPLYLKESTARAFVNKYAMAKKSRRG